MVTLLTLRDPCVLTVGVHRFEDGPDDFPPKPASAGASRRGGPASFLEDMITNDNRDWLDIATDAPGSKKTASRAHEDGRPHSAGNVLDMEPARPGMLALVAMI